MTISELRRRSNEFLANLQKHVASVVEFNDKLVEINRKQLHQSKLADGSQISRPYRHRYAMWKQFHYPESFNRSGGRVNLFLTGRLHESLELRVRGAEYAITSDVPYAYDLAGKYGDYGGIAPENLPEAQRITGELLANKYKQLVFK